MRVQFGYSEIRREEERVGGGGKEGYIEGTGRIQWGYSESTVGHSEDTLGHSEDTVRVQVGVKWDTVRVQGGYSGVTVRVQWGTVSKQ